jgi:hypothetical protein
MFRKLLERLRGSSRAPDDLALGTSRPGDFVPEPAAGQENGQGPVVPNPHEDTETDPAKDGRIIE